ncbi:hypothetical protein QJS10_CPB22g00151 [Acorus calamus]|uniref:Uncharacterized protein n=1 Tax=Acorus calamus TaxID=4465 RepID=A0AAV9C2R7_ACOCL|nr:hypothetical protein QJS10_CPB22g00151 [Acorus calamus]
MSASCYFFVPGVLLLLIYTFDCFCNYDLCSHGTVIVYSFEAPIICSMASYCSFINS